MTRLTELSQNTILLNYLNNVNERLAVSERQISTGKKADTFDDLTGQTDFLLGSKRLISKTEAYQQAAQEVNNTLELHALNFSSFETLAQDLRDNLFQTMTQDDSSILMEQLAGTLSQMVGLMNMQVDGKYMYGGTLSDQMPVSVTNLDELAALASSSDAFLDNTLKKSVAVDQGVTIQTDYLASELAQPFLAVIKSLKDYHDGTEAFTGNLSAAQQAEIETQLANLDTALSDFRDQMAVNGNNQSIVENVLGEHEATLITLKKVVSNIEDVDLAEAIIKLNQDQVQSEATMRVIGQLNQLSLMDFL